MRSMVRGDIDPAIASVCHGVESNFPALRPDKEWIKKSLIEAIAVKNNLLLVSGEHYIFAIAQSVGWAERKIVSINYWSGNPFLLRAVVSWWRKRRGMKALTIQLEYSERTDRFMRRLGFGKAMGLYIMYHEEV